eukprot:3079031-Rhodomonas_salina.1
MLLHFIDAHLDIIWTAKRLVSAAVAVPGPSSLNSANAPLPVWPNPDKADGGAAGQGRTEA